MAGGESAKIPYMFATHSNGEALKAAKTENDQFKIAFVEKQELFPSPTAGQMSDFSSHGTTPDLQLKPELTAPGGNIYSTQNNNKYTTMSGTSMAAPHVSGGIALVKQYVEDNEALFGKKTPAEMTKFVEILLMNNADILQDTAASAPYAVRMQGAGMMNLFKATTAEWTAVNTTEGTTSVGEAKIELGEVQNDKTVTIEITNYGASNISLTPKITVLEETIDPQYGTLTEQERVVSETVGEPAIVSGNGKKTFTLNLDFSGVRDNAFAEGFIEFTGSEPGGLVPEIVVPFLGFKGAWDGPKVIDVMDNLLLAYLGMADYRFFDNKATQDSQYQSSGFLNINPEGSGIFADVNKIVIAPNNKGWEMSTGITQVVPLISQLRNATSMKYQILDDDASDLVFNIGEEKEVRKMYRKTDYNLFRFATEGQWNGQKDGASVADGQYTYRIESLIDYPNATPQRDDFNLIVDNTVPVIVKNDAGELDYTYDEATKLLTMKGRDQIPEGLTVDQVSGVAGVLVYNYISQKPEFVYAQRNWTELDKATNLWEIKVDLSSVLKDNVNLVAVQLFDNGFNFSDDQIVVNPTQTFIPETATPNIYLTQPDLLNVYGAEAGTDPAALNGELELNVDGYVYGWKEIAGVTFAGEAVPTKYVEKVTLKADDGSVLHEGPAYQFQGTVTLPEGYHEALVEVTPPSLPGVESARPFSINRRFWVDLTKPTLTATPTATTTTEDSVNVDLAFSDNLFDISVYRNATDYLTKKDTSGTDGFNASVSGTYQDNVQLKDGINKITYLAKDMLYSTEVTT